MNSYYTFIVGFHTDFHVSFYLQEPLSSNLQKTFLFPSTGTAAKLASTVKKYCTIKHKMLSTLHYVIAIYVLLSNDFVVLWQICLFGWSMVAKRCWWAWSLTWSFKDGWKDSLRTMTNQNKPFFSGSPAERPTIRWKGTEWRSQLSWFRSKLRQERSMTARVPYNASTRTFSATCSQLAGPLSRKICRCKNARNSLQVIEVALEANYLYIYYENKKENPIFL